MPYTPASNLTAVAVARDLEPGQIQQFSLGVQTEVARDLMWEIGYVGTRGDHLQRSRSVNQALLASPSNPIRGETTNTVANITQRKPYLGWSTSDLRAVEAEGETVYDGLETSVTKRYSNGLQFLASYTYSKTIDSDGANAEANGQAGAGIGNQNDDRGATRSGELQPAASLRRELHLRAAVDEVRQRRRAARCSAAGAWPASPRSRAASRSRSRARTPTTRTASRPIARSSPPGATRTISSLSGSVRIASAGTSTPPASARRSRGR